MPFKLFNLLRSRRGVTLVETIIFTAIGSMLLFTVSTVYISGLNSRAFINAQQRLLYVDKFVHATLQEELASSNQIITPVSGAGSVLSFYSVDEGGVVTFSHSDTDLLMTIVSVNAGALNSIDVRIIDFQVTRFSGSPDAVRIEVVYETDTMHGRVIQHTNAFSVTLKYD